MKISVIILFWVGVVLIVDGSLGLLYLDKLRLQISARNLQRIALIEIGIGLAALVGYYGFVLVPR